MARDTYPTGHDESLPHRTLAMLRRRWTLAIAVFATVLATAVAFALYLPDLYKATALVLVERPVSEAVVRAPVAGELESRLYVIKQEILSRDRLTDLIDRFDLYSDLRGRASHEDILTQARQDVGIEAAGPEQVAGRTKTVSFTLTYTGESREQVADVANAVAAFYVEQNNMMRSNEATRTTELLAKELGDARRELERQEQALRNFANGNSSELPQQAAVTLASLERWNNQLLMNGNMQLRVRDQKDKLFEAMGVAGAAARASADPTASPESVARVRQIEDLKAKLTELGTRFGPQHPDVRDLTEQVAALEAAHAAAEAEVQRQRAADAASAAASTASPLQGRRTIADLDAELAELEREEQVIQSRINDLQQRLESTPGRQQEYTLLSRDYSAAKDVYDNYFRRYEDALLTADVEAGGAGERFRILEPAVAPEGPAAPNRMRLLILGLLLALAGAVGAVLVREQFDPSFRSVDEVRDYTTVPVLVSIPPIGPVPAGRRIRMAFATLSTVAAIVVIATLAAFFAQGNAQLVRLIAF